MSIRVVARIRPQQQHELAKDTVIEVASKDGGSGPLDAVKLENPKNPTESFTFGFSSVYDYNATQQLIFDNEFAPTIKHLFNGFDITIFAYGSTGTGKTHTMRGGKSLADRGCIPRMLSGIYRRARKIMKESEGNSQVDVTLSYYEIYNDKVFDLLEAPEKRTAAGLQLRDSNGKTHIAGLSERKCETLKDFEILYDQANVNRSTSATKLNAHSSRSHAVLRVNVSIANTDGTVRTSTASAIDLAGSEDNRRTENGKERMVESASINKSLFVLAKCVEAISQNQQRVPYRESKMTRILSLGQNNGMTIMILNLAPTRSYHLDTLSSLNFANRTKKIEVREIENEPVFKGCHRPVPSFSGTSLSRQPLRQLTNAAHNVAINAPRSATKQGDKPTKAFSVFTDKSRASTSTNQQPSTVHKKSSPLKRTSDHMAPLSVHPAKRRSPARTMKPQPQPQISKAALEDMIERKVSDILAARALEDQLAVAPQPEISDEVQRRLELLERKVQDKGKDDEREQGLTFLLMAKQHAVRGEDLSALKMYQLAKDYFPTNAKLNVKIEGLQRKIAAKKQQAHDKHIRVPDNGNHSRDKHVAEEDEEYQDKPEHANDGEYNSDDSFRNKVTSKKSKGRKAILLPQSKFHDEAPTPRTKQVLEIINTRDITRLRVMQGIGPKRAEKLLEALCGGEEAEEARQVRNLAELGSLKGVGIKTVEKMRMGITIPAA